MELKVLRDWQSNLRIQLKYLLALVFFQTACSSVPTIDQPHVAQAQSGAPQAYLLAQKKIDEGQYSEARSILEGFLSDKPVSSYTEVANFNIAYTLELERNFKEAAQKYREVAINTTHSAPKLQAYALYRLSFCLEALNDDPQVVAVLNDVFNRRYLLAQEVGNSEVPARLAAAYARVGNIDRAHELYQRASESLAPYRQANPQNRPEWFAKTLFHMGRLNLREVNWDNFEIVTRPFLQAQSFLFEAAETGNDQWSQRASQELSALYGKLWSVIQNPPETRNGDIVRARANQERQWEMTFLLYDLLEALKRKKMPDEQLSEPAEQLFKSLAKVEKQIKAVLAQQKVGSGLTPAARKRILGRRPLPKLPSKNKKATIPTPPPPSLSTPEGTPEESLSSDPNL